MKKVFDRRVLVKFTGDKEWHDTSIFHYYVYEEEEFAKSDFHYTMNTFQKAYDFVKNGYLRNAKVTSTLLTKRPQIRISIVGLYDEVTAYTEKNFEPFEVKIVYERASRVSLSTLADLLNADDFCEYLRDRNIPYTKF